MKRLDLEKYVSVVSETNADIGQFKDLSMEDMEFQDLVVSMLMNDDRINVYYHSYHVLKGVAYVNPDILIRFWDDFVLLLEHDNSYHRNYGMDLVSSLAVCIDDDRLEKILPDFYKMLYHEKISTRKYCITYSIDIIKSKPKFGDEIVGRIMESLKGHDFNNEHRALLCKEYVRLLDETDFELNDGIMGFMNMIMNDVDSPSLKKMIRKLMRNRQV